MLYEQEVIRAVVFDVGETLLDDTREWGAWADWLGATRQELFERAQSPAGELVRGAAGIAEGIEPQFVTDGDALIPKFAAPDRILLAHAGGDAGLFSMIYGGWVAGEIGSEPVTRSVDPWL